MQVIRDSLWKTLVKDAMVYYEKSGLSRFEKKAKIEQYANALWRVRRAREAHEERRRGRRIKIAD